MVFFIVLCGNIIEITNFRVPPLGDDRISNFTEKFNLISEFQFGFQKKSGTLSAASCVIDYIRSSLDNSNKNICACTFIDVTKAFDSISHELLMKKLFRLGFRGNSYNLINSYLSGRKQFISMANSNSDTLEIEFGTPQGQLS